MKTNVICTTEYFIEKEKKLQLSPWASGLQTLLPPVNAKHQVSPKNLRCEQLHA